MRKIFVHFEKTSESRDCIVSSASLTEQKRETVSIETHLHVISAHYNSEDDDNRYEPDGHTDSELDRYMKGVSYHDHRVYAETDISKGREFSRYEIEMKYEDRIYCLSFSMMESQYDSRRFGFKMEMLTNETQIFHNSLDMKEYCDTIDEDVLFVIVSSIDDVLLKDWIGEWETEEKIETHEERTEIPPIDLLWELARWDYPVIKQELIDEDYFRFKKWKTEFRISEIEGKNVVAIKVWYQTEQGEDKTESIRFYEVQKKQIRTKGDRKIGTAKLKGNWTFKIEQK